MASRDGGTDTWWTTLSRPMLPRGHDSRVPLINVEDTVKVDVVAQGTPTKRSGRPALVPRFYELRPTVARV